jgi:hypothetical protein
MTTSGSRDCGCDLVLEEGIEIIEGRTVRTSASPWLRREPAREIAKQMKIIPGILHVPFQSVSTNERLLCCLRGHSRIHR